VEFLRVFLAKRKLSTGIVGVAVLGTFAAVAFGSASSGFAPETLVTGNLTHDVQFNSDRVKLQTKDPTDVRVQRIVIAPGGYSGWHHHPGIVIVTVLSGATTFMHADCIGTTYGPGLAAGSVFVEGGDVPAQASSVGGAVNYVTFVAPHNSPPVFRIEDDPPACAA
jgi:hypothetical protein